MIAWHLTMYPPWPPARALGAHLWTTIMRAAQFFVVSGYILAVSLSHRT
jgi:hypothetical protein